MSVGFTITSDPDRTAVEAPVGGTERAGARRVRFLYVADLDPQGTGSPSEATTWSVDASSLADVWRERAPGLDVTVPDHLGGGERRSVAWRLDAADALTPAGLVRRVPELAAVAAARDALANARGGALSDLRTRLAETGLPGADALADAVARRETPAPEAAGSDALDRILGMVGDAPAPTGGVLDALVGAASGSSSDVDGAAAARAADDLGRRLAAQVVAVLDHPDVQRAEAAWRGLQFLVQRLSFRDGARLDVLAASKANLDETLHHAVLLPEHADGASRDPLVAILVGHDVSATSADFALLGELAATGASLQVPVVVTAAPGFFGFESPTDLTRMPPVGPLLDQTAYAAFRSLRARQDAAFLVVAVGAFVLRPAWGDAFPDRAHRIDGGGIVWGGAALLVGAAMAARHAATGWPTAGAGIAVEGLHVRSTRMGAMPLSASFSESVLMDLARAGFTAFAGPLNTDKAVMGSPSTVARPADGSHEAASQSRLPTAVVSALAAHEAMRIGPACGVPDGEATRAAVEARFRAWMGTTDDDAVTVQLLDEHDTETTRTLGVRLRPPPSILPGGVGVVLGVECPRTGEPTGDGA